VLLLRFPKQVVVSVPVPPIMIKAWAISVTGAIKMIFKLTLAVQPTVGTRFIIKILLMILITGVTQTPLISIAEGVDVTVKLE
jgi:hypothetical protein